MRISINTNHSPSRYIIYGLLSFCAAVVISVLLTKGDLSHNSFSYYGTRVLTIGPYTAGLLLTSWFLFKAGRSLSPISLFQPLKYGFYALSLLLITLVATPGTLGSTVSSLHVKITAVFFLIQILLAIWAVFIIRWDSVDLLLLVALVVEAFFITLFYINPGFHLLIVPEVATQLTFAAVMARSLPGSRPAAVAVSDSTSGNHSFNREGQ